MRDAPRPRDRPRSPPHTPSFVLVVGDPQRLEDEDGAVNHALELWDEPARIFVPDEKAHARVIIVEVGERPDLAASALRAARRDARLETTPSIIAVAAGQVARVEPSSGFDDFILVPYVPAELYAQIRALEWKKSEVLKEERLKVGY